VQPGIEYEYGASYLTGNNSSIAMFNKSIIAESDEQAYIEIKLDGSFGDWKLCKPVATGEEDLLLKSVRLFNTSDSLFYSLKLHYEDVQDYQLLFNLDGIDGFEYLLSNDSLFSNEGSGWVFKIVVPSFKNDEFLEAGLKLSEIGLDSIDYFTASAYINGKDIWGKGEEFSYLKYPALTAPENFGLRVSSDNPYHRIKVKWGYDKNPDKYVIERSTDDSLHFNIIAKVKSSTSYYLDDDVDSSHVYYYRMFSYKDIVRSPYTQTMWMRPGTTGINALYKNTGRVEVIPNPVTNRAVVRIALNNSDNITVELFTLAGVKIETLYKGVVKDQKELVFQTASFNPGIYLLKVGGDNTFLMSKIIVQ